MRADLYDMVEGVGALLSAAGVLTIASGVIGATVAAIARSRAGGSVYHDYRRKVGRAILLGLELLVAADIVGTVAVSPTLRNVGVLAAVVAVRTLLSLSLQVELDGQWPWQPPVGGSTERSNLR